MKKLNKISIVVLLLLGITFTSCETTDLDLLEDRNELTPDKADLERFMVAIQIDFAEYVELMGRNGAQLTRIEQMASVNYNNAFDPASTNFEWGLAYGRMFSDMNAAQALAAEIDGNYHIAIINILRAYTLMNLVDYFGDVPYSEAGDLLAFPNPSADDDAEVYAAAIELLDEASALINGEGFNINNDFYYNNDYSKWQKLANTLKMTAYLNTRLVDSDARNKFNAIVGSGNYISDPADDFFFTWNTEIIPVDDDPANDIDTRHPAYGADYAGAGAGRYRSNWLMDYMLDIDDPRRSYYFYRQISCTPSSIGVDGESCPADPEAIFCSTQGRPAHYPGSMVFCAVESGYWGRDHGFAGGIPPDTFDRTAVGVYPAGGLFDRETFGSVGLGKGGQGAGITPMILASYVDFMRAEMALVGGSAGDANAHMQRGMSRSITKVMSFGSLDPDYDPSGDTVPTSEEISTYLSGVQSDFLGANSAEQWNILALQQFILHYGNGSDSYNLYRRTGYPTSLQFSFEPAPGNFVRSFLYPADEANTNSNIQQKPNVNTQVFWDNNPASPGFPSAN